MLVCRERGKDEGAYGWTCTFALMSGGTRKCPQCHTVTYIYTGGQTDGHSGQKEGKQVGSTMKRQAIGIRCLKSSTTCPK